MRIISSLNTLFDVYHYNACMISFIIPTLCEESVIENTLQCISKYSGEKEIIISDGNSQDRTVEIARKYTDKIIVYQGKKRQTIGMARNMWASKAVWEYLVFLDADVIIENPDTFFETALKIFQKKPNIVGLTAPLRVIPQQEKISDKIIFWSLNNTYALLNNILSIWWASWEFQMVKRDIFREINGFNEVMIWGEDHDHFRRLGKKGKTHFASKLLVYHSGRRIHTVGWPKLLLTWSFTLLPLPLRKKWLKEWKVIR